MKKCLVQSYFDSLTAKLKFRAIFENEIDKMLYEGSIINFGFIIDKNELFIFDYDQIKNHLVNTHKSRFSRDFYNFEINHPEDNKRIPNHFEPLL